VEDELHIRIDFFFPIVDSRLRQPPQSGHPVELLAVDCIGTVIEQLHRLAGSEKGAQRPVRVAVLLLLRRLRIREKLQKQLLDRLAQQGHGHLVRTFLLTLIHKLHFARNGRHHPPEIGEATTGRRLAIEQHAPLSRADEVFIARNGQSRRYAALLIDQLALAGREGQLLQQYLQNHRHVHLALLLRTELGLLQGDAAGDLYIFRIVCKNLTFNTILKGRNDRPAVGIVLRIGCKHKLYVQRQPQLEAADLYVALLQDVEKRHLYARLQVGQLVDDKNRSVRAGDEAKVYHALIAVGQLEGSGFDRVYIADEVGHAHIRRCQLLDIAVMAVQPFDRRIVAHVSDEVLGKAGERLQRIIVEFAARHYRHVFVQQLHNAAGQPRFGLPAQAQQQHAVARQQRALYVRDDGVVKTNDALKAVVTSFEPRYQVVAQFLPDRSRAVAAGF